jgi:hypothetical protein
MDAMQEGHSDRSAWLRCYRCWSQRLEAQVHYDALLRIDPDSAEPAERVDEMRESVVQCLDCMHDQPHLTVEDGHVVPVEDRWERMVAGKPYVASCTVTVDQDLVETCSGPDAADFLTFGAFGDPGTREFFTHVRFHKHELDQIVIHLLIELYARSEEEAFQVLEDAARGSLELTSLAEESRPPAHAPGDFH